uniref:RNA-directed DNA polymerase, eukaryota, nucleotide-binding alpha-beta plait domain protein n=1 Tax=Tanacetum cinerariifolium TaxID=118510 RepID=A0A6L2P4K8_TANCI|nr:RNA-directed DNA polymerase, eukaryota, nucleotide-binding alpha-beta plait domain protein [Tanacetum cinerariifolium]
MYRSNADHTWLISKSIFVTNFPDYTTSNDLWKLCQTYGTVVDVYIPNRKSKAGKRFAFVRFIKVDNVDRLVGNLCTLWIGRMHIHANVVRFERSPMHSPRTSQPPKSDKPAASSYVSTVKGILANPLSISSAPAMGVDVNNTENFKQASVETESDYNAVFGVKDNGSSHLDTSISYPLCFTPEKENLIQVEQETNGKEHFQSHSKSKGCSSRTIEDAQKIDVPFSPEIRDNGIRPKKVLLS